MFTFDSKHTRIGYKIRAQEQEEMFGVVNRRQFGGNLISFHSQAPHVQGHFEIWKQVFTALAIVAMRWSYFANCVCMNNGEKSLQKECRERESN